MWKLGVHVIKGVFFQIQSVGGSVKRLEGVGDAYSSVVIQCLLAVQS